MTWFVPKLSVLFWMAIVFFRITFHQKGGPHPALCAFAVLWVSFEEKAPGVWANFALVLCDPGLLLFFVRLTRRS